MLDALIHRQNGHVPRARQAPMVQKRLKIPQHLRHTIAARDDTVDEIGPGQVQIFLRKALRFVGQQRFGILPQKLVIFRARYCRHYVRPSCKKEGYKPTV